jgi:hypothetical protein
MDVDEPGRSQLSLDDHAKDPLTVADIAFQLAGYQHVVGTLWPVGDQASARPARDFYVALTVPGGHTSP